MESEIQLLELADGIRDALLSSGFLTIKSILSNTASDISKKVGVDLYIAQIILQEAKRMSTIMAATPTNNIVHDSALGDDATPTAIAIEKKEIDLLSIRRRDDNKK